MSNESKKNRPRLLPPVVLLASTFACAALDRWLPVVNLDSSVGRVVGILMILASFAGVLLCAWEFRRRKTTIVPFHESASLITGGFFRLSRNPIYLSMTVLLCGVALTLGSATPWIIPPLFVLIISKRFIVKEEAMLRNTFGREYLEYCQRVRRWL